MSLFGAPASSASASALIAALSLDDLRQLSAKPFVRQALQSREAQVSHHVSELPAPNDGSLPAAVSGLAGADSSALPTLARSGDVQQLKAFMYSDARLHTPVSTLDRALVCAVAANHPEVVKLLVAHGANIDSLSDGGDVAADLGTDEKLNTSKADLNTTTALHVAFDARNASMVRLLVSLGASTQVPAGSSNTTVAEMIGRASSELAGLQAEQRPIAAGACALVVLFDYG
jgi:ankyrin repeat protein